MDSEQNLESLLSKDDMIAFNFKSNQFIRNPISIFCLIKEAKDEEHIMELEKLLNELRNALPKDYKIGAAVGKGDCFFDSVAQGLNELKIQGFITSRKYFNVKSLREYCAKYASKYKDEIIKDAKVGGYFVALQGPYGPIQNPRTKENIIDDNETFITYVGKIKKTSEEIDNAIWGRPEIEGNIICEKYEVKIKVIELRDEQVNGLHITTDEIGTNNNVIYIVNYRNHFVPLLNNIEKDIEKSKEVPKEEGYRIVDKNISPLFDNIRNSDLKSIEKKSSKSSDNHELKSNKKQEQQSGPSDQDSKAKKQPSVRFEKEIRKCDHDFNQLRLAGAKHENQQSLTDNNRQNKYNSLNQISQDPGAQSLFQHQQESKELSEEGKILKNAQLFNAIRKNKTTEEKLKKVQKHLDEGADVNARDANNKNNVPLHIAVLKGEPKIVKLLLDRGAIISIKNVDHETPLDIAKLPDTLNRQEIINILEANLKSLLQLSNQQVSVEQLSLVNNQVEQSQFSGQLSDQQQTQQRRTRDISKKNEQKEFQFLYQKRSGTSGLSGQLYETKLLGLILLRALNDKEIDRFYLGTNIDRIGAFDDIIFRYNLNGQERPRIIFIQAKHRDDPDKERVTVGEVRKKNGDFSLHKYLESYLRIKQKFNPNVNDDIFKGKFENIDCDFIIYTPAIENFSKKKFVEQLCTNKDDLIHTSELGKIFQFEYDDSDFNFLVKTALESRTKLLAECLAKFILSEKDNYNYIMSDELIKSYHVVLAQKVIKVSDIESGDYRKGQILPTFFNNNENLLSILRTTLYKEIIITHRKKSFLQQEEIKNLVNGILKNPSADTISKLIGNVLIFDNKNGRLKFIEKEIPQEIIQLKDSLEKMRITQEIVEEAIAIAGKEKLESLSFKLPNTFGNLNFKVRGTESKRERRLNYLTSKFIQLLKNVGIKSNIVKIDDNMVGPKEILKDGDIEINGGIGGLVGNLFILDEETKLLKFNNDEISLPENAKQLFKKLKNEISENKDLSNYRFEININGFPKLSLVSEEYDKNLVKDFLSKLKFYTNQAKEDEVETILKEEIYQHYSDNMRQNLFPFRIKGDAIFLKAHDQIQKWWKQPKKASYLTKSCKFFDQAKKDFIDSPLLTILNFIYINNVKKDDIEFNRGAIQILELDKFIAAPDTRILYIVTNENILNDIKLIQYFENRKLDNYTFINLDYVLKGGYYEAVISEFEETKLNTLIIRCKENDNLKGLYEKLENIISVFNKKIILVTDNILDEELKTGSAEKYIEKRDEKCSLIDLTHKSQTKLLEYSKVIFQGIEISFDVLISQKLKNLIDAEILFKIIKNQKIKISNAPVDSKYNDVKDYFIERTFIYNRHVKIKNSLQKEKSMFFIIDNIQDIIQLNLLQDQDIVLISDMDEDFKVLCDKHKKRNIHRLERVGNEFIWQQSHGTLSKLREFIDEQSKGHIAPKKITDLNDKIVILAAEPGMGKSTVLSKLAENTKTSDPSLWIVRVDLLDHTNEFTKWKEGKIKIDETEVAKFLYRAMDFQAFKQNAEQTKEKQEQTINNILELVTIENNEISLKNNGENMIKGLALLEIGLFNYYYNQAKIIILFDGFDEISPNYKKEVLELLGILKNSKIERLWITTRSYNIQNELEDKLSTFSHTLKPFLENDQRNFLQKFWKKTLKLSALNNNCFSIFTDELLKEFSQSINHQERGFISIPLHIKMIAKVFQDNFANFYFSGNHTFSHEHKQKLSEKLNLVTLYKEFFRIKFDEILFGEKAPRIDNKTDPKIQEMLNENHMLSIEKYKKLALYSLFNEDDLKILLSKKKRDKISVLIREVEQAKLKAGIIIRVTNNKPIFVHQTFAEYFAANYLWEKFKSIELDESKKDFIESIIIGNLIINDRIQICKFFQSESQKDLENNTNFFDKVGKLNFLFIALVGNIHMYGRRKNKSSEQSTKLLLKIIEFSLSNEEESNLEIIGNVQNLESNKRLALLSVAAEMGYIKLANALGNKFNRAFLQYYLKYNKWFYSPLWLAAENGHLDIVRMLVEKLSYDTTWKDIDKMILLQRIFQKDAFNVLRSCLSLDIINGKPYENLKRRLELPLVAALNAHAPSDVIKLLIEITDIDLVNQFKYSDNLKPSYYMSITLPKYDKEITELAIKKGIDFSKIINVMLFDFSYKSLSSPNKLRFNIIPFPNFDEKFLNLFDRIELLLKSGVGYNYKDIENQTTTLQYAKRIYYVHKLLNRVHKLHYQKNDESISPLDTLLKLIIDSMRQPPDFRSYKNIGNSGKIFLLFDYKGKSLSLFSLRYMKTISLLRDNITELLSESYRDSNSELVKSTLDKLRSYINSSKEEVEQFKKCFDYDDYENYEEIFEFQEFIDIKQRKRRYKPLDKFVKNLLHRVLELYIKQDYQIDDALEEVSEEVAKFGKVINKLLKIKNLGYEKTMYEIDEILDILDVKSIDINKELQDLMSKICECGGIKLLIQTWSDLNYIGQKKIMGILEQIKIKFFNQSSKTFELLKKLDSSYNDLTDAIENKNYQKINDILQNIEPDFIKAIINNQDDKYGSPLHYAACKDDVEVIKILLAHGANPNCKLGEHGKLLLNTTNPTMQIVRTMDPNCKLGEHGKLLLNTTNPTMQIVRTVENDEDRSLRTCLELFCFRKKFSLGKKNFAYGTALGSGKEPRELDRYALDCMDMDDTCMLDNQNKIWLLDNYEQNYKDYTPLNLAALNGHKEVIQKLICSGATFNTNIFADWKSLYIAERKGYTEIVQILLDYSLNCNIKIG